MPRTEICYLSENRTYRKISMLLSNLRNQRLEMCSLLDRQKHDLDLRLRERFSKVGPGHGRKEKSK